MKPVRSPARARVRAVSLLAASGLALASSMLTACSPAEQAPAVGYTLLDGRKGDITALRGHVVLVNFWATDCAPCVQEMPQLADMWRRFSPRGFETLAVSMSYDPPLAVSSFARSRALPFGVAIDNTGEIAGRFGDVQFTPTSVLIDKHGAIVKRWVGTTDFAALQALIDKLLAAA